MHPRPLIFAMTLASSCAFAASGPGDPSVVVKTPGLVAFWDFAEPAGQPRLSKGTAASFPLKENAGEVRRVEGGPYSGYSAEFDGTSFLHILHKELGALDIHGKKAQVSLFAAVRMNRIRGGGTIAGIWSEGKGANDDTGTRQYALLYNMGAYGGPGQLTPHISAEGGVTRRADGSAFPWCADYAASVSKIPEGAWATLGFTYDGKYIRAYFNGVMEERPFDPKKDRREDRYFTREGPDGGPRGTNPFYHGRGIFRYDAALHAGTKPIGGADFTVGACYAVGDHVGNPMLGRIGGLAVFNRALTDGEMRRLHESARIANLP